VKPCIVVPVMKYLLLAGLAVSFIGADCGSTPTGLTRSCPGSTPQTLRYSVVQGCGDNADGLITLSVGGAGSCALSLLEPSPVGLPTAGYFNDEATTTGYDLAKGNWNLQNPTTDYVVVGDSLSCTAGGANAAGAIALECNITSCGYVGDDDDPTCQTGGTCMVNFTPFLGSLDAGAPPDATTGSGDAG
jgi:hypothetical protein